MRDHPVVVWFTGLSGAGKSTLADAVHAALLERGLRAIRIDGDEIRELVPPVGFSREGRDTNVLYTGVAARLLERAGACVLASFISPYRATRERVRAMCQRFVEVHVATSLADCERRDPKGLYARARAGELTRFTGVDDPYEPPLAAELTIDTAARSLDECVALVLEAIDVE